MALAATDVDLVGDLGDFDIADFDVIQDFDVDVSSDDEFVLRDGTCHCHYSAIFSDADIVSHCRHGCEDDGDGDADSGAAATCACLLAGLGDEAVEEEAGSSSPAYSGVTDDAPLATAAGDDADAEAMSAYVAELERFLLDDDDDAPCGEQADGLLGVVDDYFAGDQLLATADDVVPAAGGAERTDDGKEEEENGDVALAAREDEPSTSRKRARNKIKGTAMLTPWGELELMNVTTMHLAQNQMPPAGGCGLFSCAVLHVECGPVGSSLDLVKFELSSRMGLES